MGLNESSIIFKSFDEDLLEGKSGTSLGLNSITKGPSLAGTIILVFLAQLTAVLLPVTLLGAIVGVGIVDKS